MKLELTDKKINTLKNKSAQNKKYSYDEAGLIQEMLCQGFGPANISKQLGRTAASISSYLARLNKKKAE
jgi:hypothetical protein